MLPRAKKAEQNTELRTHIINQYALPRDTRAIIFVNLQDDSVFDFLQKAGASLNISFLKKEKTTNIVGSDAYITDEPDEEIEKTFEHGIVSIVSTNMAEKYSLTEFNPMKFEGNAFIFEKNDEFSILEKVIRYLENVRYSGDKRTLLQNIRNTRVQ